MVVFTIKGQPMGKQRPRFTNAGNFIRTYTPRKTKDYEKEVEFAYREATKWVKNWANWDYYPKGDYLCVKIKAYFQIPKNYSKKKKEECLKGKIRPIVKSDVDNIAKIILDGLSKVAYEDDKQVVDLMVQKYYSEDPRVEVTIYEPWEKEV